MSMVTKKNAKGGKDAPAERPQKDVKLTVAGKAFDINYILDQMDRKRRRRWRTPKKKQIVKVNRERWFSNDSA